MAMASLRCIATAKSRSPRFANSSASVGWTLLGIQLKKVWCLKHNRDHLAREIRRPVATASNRLSQPEIRLSSR